MITKQKKSQRGTVSQESSALTQKDLAFLISHVHTSLGKMFFFSLFFVSSKLVDHLDLCRRLLERPLGKIASHCGVGCRLSRVRSCISMFFEIKIH